MLDVWVVLIYLGTSNAFLIEGGEYVQTGVSQESKKCQFNPFNNHLQTVSSFSLLDCGLKCSTTTDCRRIMFDRKSKICLMFESGENCFHHKNIEDKVCYRLKSLCSSSVCTRCPIGYYGDTCQHIIQDCSDGHDRNVVPKVKRMSYIQPVENGTVIEVKCDFKWGGLTYVQHRDGKCLETDFNRTWNEYVHGFGNKHGEYWLGLQNIYDILQTYVRFELSVIVVTNPGWFQGYYQGFSLSNLTDNFKYHSDNYIGNSQRPIGDSLTNGSYSIEGRPFSTYDRDYSNNNCANRFKGGWWYLDDLECSRANPNGRRNDSNDESMVQWLENLGYRHDIDEMHLRLLRIN